MSKVKRRMSWNFMLSDGNKVRVLFDEYDGGWEYEVIGKDMDGNVETIGVGPGITLEMAVAGAQWSIASRLGVYVTVVEDYNE